MNFKKRWHQSFGNVATELAFLFPGGSQGRDGYVKCGPTDVEAATFGP